MFPTAYIVRSKARDEYGNFKKYAIIVGVCMQTGQLLPLKYFKPKLLNSSFIHAVEVGMMG